MYTDVVNYNIAKLLGNKLYGDDKYAAEDLEVTWDNYLTVAKYKEGELIEDGDNVHGKYYLAPIYADVIDWLFNEKNVVIKFDPVFTFSTKNHMAYYIEAYKKNEDESKLDLIFEDKLMMYSFELAIETILKKVLL